MSENKRITKWQIDQGPPPYPNDRERELALRVMSRHERGDGSTPALLTSIAKTLATYRIELGRGRLAAKVAAATAADVCPHGVPVGQKCDGTVNRCRLGIAGG